MLGSGRVDKWRVALFGRDVGAVRDGWRTVDIEEDGAESEFRFCSFSFLCFWWTGDEVLPFTRLPAVMHCGRCASRIRRGRQEWVAQ